MNRYLFPFFKRPSIDYTIIRIGSSVKFTEEWADGRILVSPAKIKSLRGIVVGEQQIGSDEPRWSVQWNELEPSVMLQDKTSKPIKKIIINE